LRLLYVIDSLAPGGAETSLAEMAPGIVARGIDLHVLPLGDRLDLAPRLATAGAVIHPSQPLRGRIANVRAVQNTIRRTKPDLVHTTLYEADVAGRIAARLQGVPASTSIVNDSYGMSHYAESRTDKLHLARALDASTAMSARRFHAISSAIADSVAPRLGIPQSKIEVIPRGRNPDLFPFRPGGVRERTRRDLDIPPEAPVILSVGRLEPQKGLQHLLTALPAVARFHPDLIVLIAGKDGRSTQELRSAATMLRLDIRFLGHRTDVPSLLGAADVFCFPSEREGFGGVLLEALATGLPIVASSIPTTREVLGPEGAAVGILTPPGDAIGLATSLHTVLSDQHLAQEMAATGHERFRQLFSIDGVVERMTDFFHHAAR
jgi:glycosyltransferase involved in cell wall biosynthesis